jgi:DNA-directed RNA polymerase subunit H (RpoH/RPB5)
MASFNSSVLVSEIFKSRINILDLMKKQGYNVTDYENCSINEINSMKQNDQLDILLETENENMKKKMYIRYYLTGRLTPKNIQEMIDDLFILTETLKKTDTLFIIIKDEPNETLINELKHIWETSEIFIVIYCIKRLQFNILKSEYVPPHRVMDDFEVKGIMEKYNIVDKSQFPEISRFDPVAQVIGLRPGNVCHITRPSKTAIISDYYAICV